MKILVTGATGSIGSRLIPRLLENRHEVVCLLRSPPEWQAKAPFSDCTCRHGDITIRESLKGVADEVDIVVHLAVSTPLSNPAGDEDLFFRTNVLGTQNLLEECLRAKPKRILCFSSTAAIGRPAVDVIDETTVPEPTTPYGISKKTADDMISHYHVRYGLPVITLCFPHVYGPGETDDFLKVVRMMRKGIFPQVGFCANHLPMIFVSDAVESICLAISRGTLGEKYIVADADPHDTRVIRKIVLRHLGIQRRLFPFIPLRCGIMLATLMERCFPLMGSDPAGNSGEHQIHCRGTALVDRKIQAGSGFFPRCGH
jgi:dihydroflavonol-4-reductase